MGLIKKLQWNDTKIYDSPIALQVDFLLNSFKLSLDVYNVKTVRNHVVYLESGCETSTLRCAPMCSGNPLVLFKC